jgi:hypothetical protein
MNAADNDKFFPVSRLEEANQFLALSDDELLRIVGREGQLEGFPQDWLRSGREKYRAVVKKCETIICASPKVQKLCTDNNKVDATHLVCAVADAIAHGMGVPVPAMTIAAIVVHQGLHRFCKSHWDAKGKE